MTTTPLPTKDEPRQPTVTEVEFSPCPHCSLRAAFEAWTKLYPDQAARGSSSERSINVAESCIIAASRLIADHIHAAPDDARGHLVSCLNFTLNADINGVAMMVMDSDPAGKPPGETCH